MHSRACRSGISPIIGILIMVAITLVLAGVAAIWFFGFANTSGDGDDEMYILSVTIDGSDDAITFSVVSGDILKTEKMVMKLDGTDIEVPDNELAAGSEMTVDAGEDLEPGTYYNVKITVNNKLVYDNDLVAAP